MPAVNIDCGAGNFHARSLLDRILQTDSKDRAAASNASDAHLQWLGIVGDDLGGETVDCARYLGCVHDFALGPAAIGLETGLLSLLDAFENHQLPLSEPLA